MKVDLSFNDIILSHNIPKSDYIDIERYGEYIGRFLCLDCYWSYYNNTQYVIIMNEDFEIFKISSLCIDSCVFFYRVEKESDELYNLYVDIMDYYKYRRLFFCFVLILQLSIGFVFYYLLYA